MSTCLDLGRIRISRQKKFRIRYNPFPSIQHVIRPVLTIFFNGNVEIDVIVPPPPFCHAMVGKLMHFILLSDA